MYGPRRVPARAAPDTDIAPTPGKAPLHGGPATAGAPPTALPAARPGYIFALDIEIGMTMISEFEQLVMLALMRLGEEAYGVPVQEEIERRTGRSVSAGTVDRALLRLETKGLVVSWEGEPTPERGGRRKRHYRVLAEGRQLVADSLAALGRMAEGIEGLPRLGRPGLARGRRGG